MPVQIAMRGSHPNIEFFRTVLGIDSDASGFSKIKVEPHLGSLNVSEVSLRIRLPRLFASFPATTSVSIASEFTC